MVISGPDWAYLRTKKKAGKKVGIQALFIHSYFIPEISKPFSLRGRELPFGRPILIFWGAEGDFLVFTKVTKGEGE